MDIKATMMQKKIWAVVGVSERPERFGYKIWKILKQHGYTAYGVSPKYEVIDGEKIYPSLHDLPEVPEVVNMVVNPAIAEEILKEAEEVGSRYVFFQPNSYNQQTLILADELGLQVLIGDCVYATLARGR